MNGWATRTFADDQHVRPPAAVRKEAALADGLGALFAATDVDAPSNVVDLRATS